jgi:hypothetical protein
MKTSHFEGSIAHWAARTAHGRDERTQRELAAFDINPTSATGQSKADHSAFEMQLVTGALFCGTEPALS